MLSVIYIIFCAAFGWILIDSAVPGIKYIGRESYGHKELGIPALVYMLPASWLVGTIFHTWLVYIAAFVVVKIDPGIRYPLTPANIIAAVISLAISILLYFLVIRKREKAPLDFQLTRYMLLLIPTVGFAAQFWTTPYIATTKTLYFERLTGAAAPTPADE